jgi:hypothetical protein
MTARRGSAHSPITFDPFSYWSRVADSWMMMNATGERLARTAAASLEVISARSDKIGSAMRSPMTGDYVELSRMVPEKVEAFSAVATVIAQAWWKAQGDLLDSMSRTASAGVSGRWPTPFDLFRTGSDVSYDVLKTMEGASRLGRDALAPIHKTATSNARRLKRQ